MSLAVEQKQTSTWIRRGGRTRLRGIPAWTVMALLGVIALSPIVASATTPPAFTLGGTAFRAMDPTNAANFVISMDTSGPADFGFVTRTMSVPFSSLTGFLSVDYYLAGRDCGGGSPRISLSVDVTGDGIRDGTAFGYVGPTPSFTGCAVNAWQTADLTDSDARWDLTKFGGPFYNTWSQALTFFAGMPFSTVVRGSLVDDSAWMPAAAGLAYYDNVVIGDQVLAGPGDVISSDAPVHLDIASDHVIDADYGTIQAAVNAADPSGDTVIVDAGTYSELVTITKSVTLMGAQAGVSACGRVLASESIVGTPNGAFQVLADNVVIDGFTITGVDGSAGISSLGAGIWTTGTNSGHGIRNNILTGNTMGLYLNSDGRFPSVVEGNSFDSNNVAGAAAGNGIYSDQGANRIRIQNNCFAGQDNAAMVFAGAFPPATTTQSDIAVSDNTFLNDAGGAVFFFTTGLTITGNSWTNSAGTSVFLGGGVHDVSITQNTFRNAAFRGIRVLAGLYGDTELDTNVVAEFNNFITNAAEGLRVDTASYSGTFDATCNWWGDPSGPAITTNPAGTGDEIFDADGVVHFVPWLSTAIPNPCSGPVHLDIASNGVFDVNFGMIQPALNTANAGDTVYVDAGTYTEQVVVRAGIHLLPTVPGSLPTIRAPAFASRSTFTIPSSGRTWDAIAQLRGDGAEIQGFRIDGAGEGGFCSGRSFTGIMMHGGQGMKAIRNLVTGIQDSPFSGCQAGLGVAMYADNVGDPTTGEIALNTIRDYQKGGIVVNILGSVASVHDNVVAGIGPTDIIAQNGIQFGFGAGGSAVGNDVRGHVYSLAGTVSVGILLFDAADGVVVLGNNVDANQAGIYAFASNSPQISFNSVNAVFGGALGIVVDQTDSALVYQNVLGAPAPAPNMDEIIGIEAIQSTNIAIDTNGIDFGGNVGLVSNLYGISSEDSSGRISNNFVLNVKMQLSFFGVQTGIGIVATGTGDLLIQNNVVTSYQKGGIVVGRIGNGLGNDPVHANVLGNQVTGVGPTDVIAQNGIQIADTASAIVENNVVAWNIYTGGYWTATGILAYSAASGLQVRFNTLVANQIGVYVFDTANAIVRTNEIDGSAVGVVIDTSDDALVTTNVITNPVVVANEPEVIGIWAIGSARVTASQNVIDFGGAVGVVANLRGISLEDSSGTIAGNTVRGVRMAGADFARLTGVGISAIGAGNLRIADNTVTNYQWGGIFVGLPNSPYSGRVDIVNNLVRGVGPTPQIRQIGILLVGPGVTGSVRGNFIADNCFTGGGGRNGNGHDDDNEHGNHDHEGKDRDDDHGGNGRCRGDFDVKDRDRRTCPPSVAVGLLLCNVDRDTLDVSRNRFSGNQVDFLRVRT